MIKEIELNEFTNKRSMEWDVVSNQPLAIELVQALSDTLEANPDLYCLCANEIGYKERAFALKFIDDCKIFMNPIFQHKDDLRLVREYDPLTKKQYIIPRYTDVTLCFQNSIGKIEATKFNGQASALVSQAMSRLDGIQPSDYGLEVLPEFDDAPEEIQNQLLTAYMEALKVLRETLESELSKNEETKKEWDAFKFMQAKASGKIKSDDSGLSKRKKKFFDKIAKKIRRKKK